VIFVHPIDDNFVTTLLCSLLIVQKQWREKKEERETRMSCEYERESCSKVVA